MLVDAGAHLFVGGIPSHKEAARKAAYLTSAPR